jgi:undecaprenyl-diphosphatase
MSPSLRERFLRLVRWVGGLDLAVLLALLVVVGGVWAFAELADEVVEGATQRFDEHIVRSLRHPDNPKEPLGPAWLKEVSRDITALGGVAVLSLLVAIIVGFFLIARMPHAAGFILVAVLGGLLLSTLLKAAFGRERPEVPHLSYVYTSSFPSGHSLLSACTYLGLGALLARFTHKRRLKLYFVAVALLLTFLVGLSRIYLGVHYPTDVLAGWTAGLVWAVVCWLAARWLQHRGAVERDPQDEPREEPQQPGMR